MVTMTKQPKRLSAWTEREIELDLGERFLSRWTLASLARIDRALYDALIDQRNMLDELRVTGTDADRRAHEASMARGWQRAIQVMESAREPDNAYVVGRCPKTGFLIAISEQRPSAKRVRELHGEGIIWTSPDEIASIFASIENFKPIAAIKRMFPGAEVLDVRPHDPAKSDGLIGDETI